MSPRILFALTLLSVTACKYGAGSEIGPALGELPQRELSVQVRDPDGKAVVAARLTVKGSSALGVTEGSGRAFLASAPMGSQVLAVDASQACADGSDRLAGFALRLNLPGGRASLAAPIVLPDFAAGARQTLAIGSLASGVTLSQGGATLSLGAGTSVSRGSASGKVEISLSTVDDFELPPVPLPLDAGTTLVSRGAWILPLDVAFGPGARLELANDLALPASGTAQLWRFDGVSGVWSLLASASLVSSRLRIDVDQLPGGGLYVFSTKVASSTTVSGQVVDSDDKPVPGAIVASSGGRFVRAGQDGSFSLGPLPAVDAAGSARSLPLRISAPPTHEPRLLDRSLPATGPLTASAKSQLASRRCGQLRVLLAQRGRALPGRSVAVASSNQARIRYLITDSSGTAVARDMSYGLTGFRWGYMDGKDFYSAVTVGRFDSGFYHDQNVLPLWYDPLRFGYSGFVRAFVVQAESGAPIEAAYVQGQMRSDTGRFAPTDSSGFVSVEVSEGECATAYYRSAQQGRTYHSAYSVDGYSQNLAEFPLELAPPAALGSYGKHARFRGTLRGSAGSGLARRMLVRAPLRPNDWRRIQLGGPLRLPKLPRVLDPELTGQLDYDLGVPVPLYSVSAVEGSLSAAVLSPERVGYVRELASANGSGIARDIALDLPLDHSLRLRSMLQNLDPSLSSAELRFALGLDLGDDRAIALHGAHGGVQVSASDLLLKVPALGSARAWLGALSVKGVSAGVTRSQHYLVDTNKADLPTRSFLPVPVLTAPAPGSTVASAEKIVVTWTPHQDVSFYELEIRSENSSSVHSWRVLLPGDRSSFTFGGLRQEMKELLAPARTWTLTLRAKALAPNSVFDRQDGYRRIQGWLQSLGVGERYVERMSTISFSFATP
ncbi:MAG: hypothetical protein CSA62_13660 [Planctomycetota bacterium]|nr:MAG: hypothetical protein CSA62_13660 [Planctomycetota bacterium]